MCNGCKDGYDNMLKTYDLLTKWRTATYFDQDRIYIVLSTESVLTSLWTKAYCDDCFNNNISIIFEDLKVNFDGCLLIHHGKPCDDCKNEYVELNTFFNNLSKQNNGEVCFDVQDAMNRTRYKWSKELLCYVRQYNILYFSIALSITTLTTVLFYYCTYLLTKRQERNHGILNNEDSLFNSPSSSLAIATTQLNIGNNQRQIINRLPANNKSNNLTASVTLSQTYDKDKDSKTSDEENSSDEEPLI